MSSVAAKVVAKTQPKTESAELQIGKVYRSTLESDLGRHSEHVEVAFLNMRDPKSIDSKTHAVFQDANGNLFKWGKADMELASDDV